MQLWLKKNNNIELNGLWQITQDEVQKILHPAHLCAPRMLPAQYLSLFTDRILQGDFSKKQQIELSEKIFWNNITGGHPELQRLFEENGYDKNADTAVLFGHNVTRLTGHGRFAAVYDIDDQYVIKVTASCYKKKLRCEFDLLSQMNCTHIVKAYDYYDAEYGAGILLEKLNPPSNDADGYFNALMYLHSCGLCHGDIRYTNLGSGKNNCAKLLDFGNAFYGSAQIMKQENIDLRLILEKFNLAEKR